MTEPLIAVDDVVKTYGARTALDHVRFAVTGGIVTGLLGPNGAGKSTTLSIVATLLVAGRAAVPHSTHYRGEGGALCAGVVRLAGGGGVATGTPAERVPQRGMRPGVELRTAHPPPPHWCDGTPGARIVHGDGTRVALEVT